MKISIFRGHAPDLSLLRKSPQGIESKQRMHFWIALSLRNLKKLVPCKTNTQILSNVNFPGQKLPKILGHYWHRFPLKPNYSMSREGSTSHLKHSRRNTERWVRSTPVLGRSGVAAEQFSGTNDRVGKINRNLHEKSCRKPASFVLKRNSAVKNRLLKGGIPILVADCQNLRETWCAR